MDDTNPPALLTALAVSLGLIMSLRIVAREHHAVTDACKAWAHTAGEDQQR
jgi:hypothetical protein